MLEDPLDVRQEAHVQHSVGFVEHQHLEPAELGVRLLEVVEQPARGRDDHVHATAEGVLLRPHPHPAEHCRTRERGMHGELAEMLVDLRCQLTSRRQDERPRRATRLRHEPVQDRQQERRRLATPRHGAGEQIAAFHGGRNGLLLNGSGAREA